MRSGLFALAMVWFTLVPPSNAQAPAVSNGPPAANSELNLQSYKEELSRVEAEVKTGNEIRDLRKSLPDSWVVNDAERSYRVPTKEITDALAQIEKDPQKTEVAEHLSARLEAMRRHAEDLSRPGSGPSSDGLEQKLKKILDRAEFQDAAAPSAWDQARARLTRSILEHILGLLRMLHISEKTGNTIAWGAIFLAVVWLFYVIYGWLTKTSKVTQLRAETEPVVSDARQWVRDALAAADRGDFREAIHCAYWATVARLEDIRVLPRDRARTPRESLRLLEHHPKEEGGLQAITHKFELIWYGYRPASSADWAGAKEQLEKMGCLQASTAPTVPS